MRRMALLCSLALLTASAVNANAMQGLETSEALEETEKVTLPEATDIPEEPGIEVTTQTKAGVGENAGYDLDAPVIESISIDKQGQTVTDGDTVKISVKAYDAGVGIDRISCSLCYVSGSDENSSMSDEYLRFSYNEATGLWEASFAVKGGAVQRKMYIYTLNVEDKNGNRVSGIVSDDETFKTSADKDDALYWFNVAAVEGIDQELPVIQSFELSGRQVSLSEELMLTVYASDNSAFGNNSWAKIKTARVNEDGSHDSWYTHFLSWNADKNVFEARFRVEEDCKPGQYEITRIKVRDEAGNEATIEPEEEYYTIINENYDAEKPQIKSISMERTGETLQRGDSVKLTVEATDNRAVEGAYVEMRAAASSASNGQRDCTVDLNRIEGTDRWEGSFVVDDGTYPCEWYISHVRVYDASHNDVRIEGYFNGSYAESMPFEDISWDDYLLEEKYYVNVMQGNTFVEEMETIGCMDICKFPGDERVWYEYTANITVPRRASAREVLALCPAPEGLEGLHCEGWKTWHGFLEDMGDQELCWGSRYNSKLNAIYDKKVINLGLRGEDHKMIYWGVIFGQEGEKLTLPKELPGVRNIQWDVSIDLEYDGIDSIYVGRAQVQSVYGSAELDPNSPVTPEAPAVPDIPDTPSEPEYRPVTLPEEKIAEVSAEIADAGNGAVITVNMGDATVVPKDILEAAKGKNVDIVLQMDGYSWRINGTGILASVLTDINLKVVRNTSYIPSNVIARLAGDNPVEQIALEHEGDFGFKADLTINVGSQYAGKKGNLYWHDSSGRMTFVDAGTIDASGNVTLGFSHASNYALVITDQTEETGAGTAAASTNNMVRASKTGDEQPVVPYLVLLVGGFLGIMIAGVRIKKRRVK